MKKRRIAKYILIGVAVLFIVGFLWQRISRMETFEKKAEEINPNITAVVEPAVMPAHVSAPIRVRIAFPDGLKRGSNISTQLPNAALTYDLSYSLTKTLQKPASIVDVIGVAIGYIFTGRADTREIMLWDTVTVTSPDAPKAKFSLRIRRLQFDDVGKAAAERHGQRVTAVLKGADIPPGGEVVMTYSTTTPWVASGAFPVRVDVNKVRMAQDPTFVVEAGSTASRQVIVPSSVRPGEPFKVEIISRDKYDNLSASEDSVNLSLDGEVLDEMILYTGRAERVITLDEPGIYRFDVSGTLSNAVRITDTPNGPWWGDLHSHNAWSADALSSLADPDHYTYARDVSALDYAALTNHVFGLEAGYWQKTQDWCESYNAPGEFVTILGFEGGIGYHLDGYFPTCSGPAIESQRYGAGRGMNEDKLTALEEDIDREQMIVATHHTGIGWGGANFDGSHRFPRQMRHIEIFSAHGQSEMYDPSDPLSYENAGSTPGFSLSKRGAHYVRDAWAAGMKLFTLAASDDHNGQPGKRANGLTAIMAPELTRDALLQSMRDGAMYGTTGERILLDFSANGQPMGSVLSEDVTELDFRLEVHGTAGISEIEVYRYVFGEDAEWEPVFHRSGDLGLDFEAEWTAPAVGHAIYYARVEQAAPIRVTIPTLQDRPVRAWSSPIWVGEPEIDW